jgi:hypothetical protein
MMRFARGSFFLLDGETALPKRTAGGERQCTVKEFSFELVSKENNFSKKFCAIYSL